MVEFSFMNKVVVGSSPVAVTCFSDLFAFIFAFFLSSSFSFVSLFCGKMFHINVTCFVIVEGEQL